jgi:potassium-transporting ATPase KdpC subunit
LKGDVMLQQVRTPVVLLLLFTLLTGIAYPLAVSGFAWVMMHEAALGSLVVKDGRIIGSSVVGQSFVAPQYFHPRPSATDPPYNAASSTGSNLGPITEKLIDRVKGDVAALRAQGVSGPVPVDAVTTSASGLDPDISPETALLQVPRVAQARSLPEAQVRALVQSQIEGRALGFLGEPHVNVLGLNLALDGLKR